MDRRELVHFTPARLLVCWLRCDNTYVLMLCRPEHFRMEWRVAGEVVLRRVYEEHQDQWAAIVITDEGKRFLDFKATKEEAWALVEECYSSETKQTPSVDASSTC